MELNFKQTSDSTLGLNDNQAYKSFIEEQMSEFVENTKGLQALTPSVVVGEVEMEQNFFQFQHTANKSKHGTEDYIATLFSLLKENGKTAVVDKKTGRLALPATFCRSELKLSPKRIIFNDAGIKVVTNSIVNGIIEGFRLRKHDEFFSSSTTKRLCALANSELPTKDGSSVSNLVIEVVFEKEGQNMLAENECKALIKVELTEDNLEKEAKFIAEQMISTLQSCFKAKDRKFDSVKIYFLDLFIPFSKLEEDNIHCDDIKDAGKSLEQQLLKEEEQQEEETDQLKVASFKEATTEFSENDKDLMETMSRCGNTFLVFGQRMFTALQDFMPKKWVELLNKEFSQEELTEAKIIELTKNPVKVKELSLNIAESFVNEFLLSLCENLPEEETALLVMFAKKAILNMVISTIAELQQSTLSKTKQ